MCAIAEHDCHNPQLRLVSLPSGEQEDDIEPCAQVVRPRVGVVGPIAEAGLELDGLSAKFDEFGISTLIGTDH